MFKVRKIVSSSGDRALAIALFCLCLWVVLCVAGKGKCVQCALALEFFRAVAIFFVFFPEASAIQSSVGRCQLLSKCSFFVCQFNVSTVVIGFPVTFRAFAQLAVKRKYPICHKPNLGKNLVGAVMSANCCKRAVIDGLKKLNA